MVGAGRTRLWVRHVPLERKRFHANPNHSHADEHLWQHPVRHRIRRQRGRLAGLRGFGNRWSLGHCRTRLSHWHPFPNLVTVRVLKAFHVWISSTVLFSGPWPRVVQVVRSFAVRHFTSLQGFACLFLSTHLLCAATVQRNNLNTTSARYLPCRCAARPERGHRHQPQRDCAHVCPSGLHPAGHGLELHHKRNRC